MAHFTRTQTDATWTNGGAEGYVLPRADLESLDAKQFKSINGDRGGTWRPSSPISLTGGDPDGHISFTGPLKINYGGKLTLEGAGGGVFLPANTFPKFAEGHVLRERKILTPCIFARKSNGYHWGRNVVAARTRVAIQSIACTIQEQYYDGASLGTAGSTSGLATLRTRLIQPVFSLPLRVHDGARLASVQLCWRVSSARRDVPAAMPKLRVIRVSKDGKVEPLASETTGADADGWISVPQVASFDEWYQNDEPRRLAYACDTLNTVDVSSYAYYLQVTEEQAVNVPLADGVAHGGVVRKKPTAYAVATENVDMSGALPTIDGVTVPYLGLFLLTAQTAPEENGLWVNAKVVGGGTFVREPSLASANQTNGYTIVSIAKGTINAGSVWQLTAAAGGGFAGRHLTIPVGNMYHSAVCSFDSIVDMRPQ